MKPIFYVSAALSAFALLSGCGSPEAAAPAAPAASTPVETVKTAPEIGDKIGEEGITPAAQAAAETREEAKARREAALAKRAAEEEKRKAELAANGIRELGWEELMPEGEEERLAAMYQSQMQMLYGGAPIAEGSAADKMTQIGTFNVVPELNGLKVRLPGYTVPFEYGSDAEITEFLLVPYFGACIHSPPPPPNQTIFVITDTPVKLKDLAQAVWVEGTLSTQTQTSELADAAYTITLTKLEEYDY